MCALLMQTTPKASIGPIQTILVQLLNKGLQKPSQYYCLPSFVNSAKIITELEGIQNIQCCPSSLPGSRKELLTRQALKGLHTLTV